MDRGLEMKIMMDKVVSQNMLLVLALLGSFGKSRSYMCPAKNLAWGGGGAGGGGVQKFK
jgi:hypothetical protein